MLISNDAAGYRLMIGNGPVAAVDGMLAHASNWRGL
jgi:hypothetical protein